MEFPHGMRTCPHSGLVVSKDGIPVLMYHGTRRRFTDFQIGAPIGAPGNPAGIYFTPDRGVAEEYSCNDDGEKDAKSRVICALIRIRDESDGVVIDSAYRGLEFSIFNSDNIFILPEKKDTVFMNAVTATVFHGTDAEFGRFDCSPKHDLNSRRLGAYFTTNQALASLYGTRVIQASVHLSNPLDIRGLDARAAIDMLPISCGERAELRSAFRGTDYMQYGLLESLSPIHLRVRLEVANYDGIIYSEAGGDAFIAFSPAQLKLAPMQSPTKTSECLQARP